VESVDIQRVTETNTNLSLCNAETGSAAQNLGGHKTLMTSKYRSNICTLRWLYLHEKLRQRCLQRNSS
jgi:hypothetical protein